jgi:hypothetical protein
VLARLDEIDGVERSYANRAGTLLRLSIAASADPDRVSGEALRVLGDRRNPTRLGDDERDQALGQEEWRGADRVGELSAIERRTLILRGSLWLVGGLAVVVVVVLLIRRLRRAWKAARRQAPGSG